MTAVQVRTSHEGVIGRARSPQRVPVRQLVKSAGVSPAIAGNLLAVAEEHQRDPLNLGLVLPLGRRDARQPLFIEPGHENGPDPAVELAQRVGDEVGGGPELVLLHQLAGVEEVVSRGVAEETEAAAGLDLARI